MKISNVSIGLFVVGGLALFGVGMFLIGDRHQVFAEHIAYYSTFGNLAAYLQTNLKRLLAYSTIAHAGYMMMGLAPLTRDGAAAVLFYLIAYLFMNLGAFAVVAFLRRECGDTGRVRITFNDRRAFFVVEMGVSDTQPTPTGILEVASKLKLPLKTSATPLARK